MWKIFEFPMHHETQSVYRLPVHLPDQHRVSYHENDPIQDVMNRTHTKLTKFFEYCAANPEETKEITYDRFPEEYAWADNKWKKRRNSCKTIGRIYHVHPSETEKFCLRSLLINKASPKSFEDIRTVNNVIYSSFKAAAIAFGLFDDDSEWQKCMEEAATFRMPKALRRLFASILAFSEPADIRALWEKFYLELSEDFRLRIDCELTVLNLVCSDIEETLLLLNKTWNQYEGLPHFTRVQEETNRLIREEVNYNVSILEQHASQVLNLNQEQKYAFEKVMESIECSRGQAFFIDGPGGSGKTYLYNTILGTVRNNGKIALAVASSGIAAMLLDGGRTAHSRFKINLDTSDCFCNVSRGSLLGKQFYLTI
jgi:hypothetical protein